MNNETRNEAFHLGSIQDPVAVILLSYNSTKSNRKIISLSSGEIMEEEYPWCNLIISII